MRVFKIFMFALGLCLANNCNAVFGQVLCQVIVQIECETFSEIKCRDAGTCTIAPGFVKWRCTTGLYAHRPKTGTYHGVAVAGPNEAGFFNAVHGSQIRCEEKLKCDADCEDEGIFENTWYCKDEVGAIWRDVGPTYVTLSGENPCQG